MFFRKKSSKDIISCPRCKDKVNNNYSFCPSCGQNMMDQENYLRRHGLLGKHDYVPAEAEGMHEMPMQGITDKILNSLINSLMKNIDQQFRDIQKAEVNTFPNGIKIRIGVPTQQRKTQQKKEKEITPEQIKKMNKLPRTEAKTYVRRLSDKVVYELSTPGVVSPSDVFVSKIESGYEIKAIGDKRIYVNSLSINLPLRGVAITDNKLFVEFRTEE